MTTTTHQTLEQTHASLQQKHDLLLEYIRLAESRESEYMPKVSAPDRQLAQLRAWREAACKQLQVTKMLLVDIEVYLKLSEPAFAFSIVSPADEGCLHQEVSQLHGPA